MPELPPRYEYRAFAQSFGLVAERIRAEAECREIGESSETYLVAERVEDCNVKARHGCLELKRLVGRRGALERWWVVTERRFPLPRTFLRATVLPALDVHDAELGSAEYSLAELLTEVVGARADLVRALVFKRRFHFVVGGCPTEIDELLVNGAALRSVAVESEDPAAVTAIIDRLGLGEYENVNYPRAIRRTLGLERLPGEVA